MLNIGLAAHDAKKELMINFCIAYKNILAKHRLYATGTTGQQIEDIVGLNVKKFLPGNLGGSRQMAAQIECDQIDAMIYLRDPIGMSSHELDYENINRLCDSNNVPIASNLASAELLILSIDHGDLDWREVIKKSSIH